MPDTMSIERRTALLAPGAELVLTPAANGVKGCIQKAQDIAASTPNSWIPDQFGNPNNPMAHYQTTGPELMVRGVDLDVLVAGVGTGRTITGAGRYIKEQKPEAHIVAVEPTESPVLSGGAPSPHKIMGIGAGFVPPVLDTKIYDEVAQVSSADALEMAGRMAKTEGLFVGVSLGAAVAAAVGIAKRSEMTGKNIVCIIPSFGEQYLSTLFEKSRTEAAGMTAVEM